MKSKNKKIVSLSELYIYLLYFQFVHSFLLRGLNGLVLFERQNVTCSVMKQVGNATKRIIVWFSYFVNAILRDNFCSIHCVKSAQMLNLLQQTLQTVKQTLYANQCSELNTIKYNVQTIKKVILR